ncbi:IS3 family transposase [Anoxybacillus rupiensis]|uniref:IS3 family transposase n=3 Tax=Anoxybacillaceae TaxID=3120669 RepID=A0ABT5W8Y2_9BACL|nr:MULTISPECIES: IS3 family transposase [Anoxybacillus]MDE8565787.1 IS3 family transposase [Anoxybacillus rupiensis]QHC03326.1 IS3 family transposase [Anoxybacillus sp. PDR2]
MEKRNRYTAEFKTKVVMEVLREEQTMNEIAGKYEISPVMLSRWKAEFVERASMVFGRETKEAEKMKRNYKEKQEQLEKLVGQLTLEVSWLKKNLASKVSTRDREAMVERDHPKISIKRQAELLSIHRTNVYRQREPRQETPENVQLMHEIDKLYTKHPFFGYRRMSSKLQEQGWRVNRKRVQRLMRVMGIEVIYPSPNLSKRYHAQYIRPYLLRGLKIDRPNQVWGIDITYLRMGKGFMYLFVIIDWYSRKIIDYELSSTLEKAFVLTCLKRALGRCQPEIMNSDQGSHFTNQDYLDLLIKHNVNVSMDGKGRARDNSRTERFFRSLKYEEIYLNEYENPRALRKAITAYLRFYHTERPHQALGYAKPADVYARTA